MSSRGSGSENESEQSRSSESGSSTDSDSSDSDEDGRVQATNGKGPDGVRGTSADNRLPSVGIRPSRRVSPMPGGSGEGRPRDASGS